MAVAAASALVANGEAIVIEEGSGGVYRVEFLDVDVGLDRQVKLGEVVGRLREGVERPGLPSAAPLVDQDLEDGDLFNHNVEVVEAVREEVDALRVQEAFARVPVSDGGKSRRVDGRRSRIHSSLGGDTVVRRRRRTQVGRSRRTRVGRV